MKEGSEAHVWKLREADQLIIDFLLKLLRKILVYTISYFFFKIFQILNTVFKTEQKILNTIASVLSPAGEEVAYMRIEKIMVNLIFDFTERLTKLFSMKPDSHGLRPLTKDGKILKQIIVSHPEVFEWRFEKDKFLFVKLAPNWKKYVRVDQKIVEKARYYLHLNSIQVTFLTHLRSSSTLKEIVWFHLKPVLKKLKSRINVQDKKDPVIEHIGIIYFKLKNVQKIMKEKEFQYLITTPDFYSEIFIIVKDFVELSRLVISMARKLLVTKSQKSDSQKRIHYHNRASSYARKFCKKWKYLKEGGHVTIDLDIIVKDFLLHYVLDEKAKLQEIKKQLKEMTVYIPFDGTCDELFKNLTYYKVEIWVTMLLEKIVRNMVKGEKKKKLITDYIDSIEYEVLNLLFENPEGLSKNEIAKILASQTNKSARACQNWLSKVLPQLEEKGLIRNGKHENWRLNF